jgi:hypothetical protein
VADEPTRLWLLQRGSHEVACLARLVPYAIEVDVSYDGRVLVTRSFGTDDEALAWAMAKRRAREAQGWTPVQSTTEEPARPAN